MTFNVRRVEDVQWRLKFDPREVQLEALRRSYYGYQLKDKVDAPEDFRPYSFYTGEPFKGWAHFMEQRTGKTPTTLAEYRNFREDFGFKWAVIFAPNHFKEDWPVEAEKFDGSYPTFAFTSGDVKGFQKWYDRHKNTGGLVAINYEALRSKANAAVLEQILGDRTYISADEAVVIKNPDSTLSKQALYMAKMCAVRRVLTGKPITQGPHDIYHQLRFAGQLNGILYASWKAAHCVIGGFQGKQILPVVRNEERLHAILDSCSFSARKVDWLRTPGKDYAVRRVELLPDQYAKYVRMQEDFLVEVAEGIIVSADQIVTKLLKMQQIASGFIIDEDGVTVHHLMPPEKNPKVAALRDMLRDEVSTKAIVITHYRPSMDILIEALKEFNPAVIRGQEWHKKNDRPVLAEKERFNNDPKCRVLLGQDQAVKYGHTLMGNPADPCHTEIVYENSYSLNDRSQYEERPQGEGQSAPITIWDFIVTKKDLDNIKALQAKEDVASIIQRYARETGVLPGDYEGII